LSWRRARAVSLVPFVQLLERDANSQNPSMTETALCFVGKVAHHVGMTSSNEEQ